MAATDYTQVVQQLYISYFGRPADPGGLTNFTAQLLAADPNVGTDLALTTTAKLSAYSQANPTSAVGKLVGSFANKVNPPGNDHLSILKFVNDVYNNIFHRDADAGGNFWVNAIETGAVSRENAALAITEGALSNTSAQGLADAALVAKVNAIATDFTSSLDTIAKVIAFSGDAAANVAAGLLKQVTATTDLTAYHQNVVDAIGVLTQPPSTLTALTTDVDNLPGTIGNDVFTGTNKTFTGLDTIDGGAGNDTLKLSDVDGDQFDLSIATVKNVETATVTSTLGLKAGVADVSTWAGLTSATFTLNNIKNNDQSITAAGTTALTVNATGAIKTTALNVTGGSTTAVTLAASGTTDNSGKTINVKGAAGATTTVSVTQTVTGTAKTAAVSIADANQGSATKANTISTVTIDGIVDATATVASDALTSLTLANSSAAVSVTSLAATRTLGVTLNGNSTGAAVTDNNATTLNVTTTGTKSTTDLTAGAATKVGITAGVDLTVGTLSAGLATAVTVGGAGKVAINALTAGSLTSIDASTNTGGVTVTTGTALATGVAFTGGAGKDSVTIGATTKAIAMGAGDDTVTITASVGTGGTIDGGAGSDTLAGAATVLSTLTGVPADAAKYIGFETLKVTDVLANAATIDVSKIAGVVNFTSSGVATGGSATVTGLGANANVTMGGAIVSSVVVGAAEVFTIDVSGTTAVGADTYAFDGTTITVADTDNAATIAGKIAAGTYTHWTTSVTGNVVTFTNKAQGPQTDASSANFVFTDVAGATTHTEVFHTTTQGATAVSAAGNGTLALVQAVDTANDVINLKLNANYTENNDATGTITAITHTVDASLIETLKVTSTGNASAAFAGATGNTADGVSNTLVVTDVALVNLSVTGDQAFTFASAAAQTKLATIDASALTAGATIDAGLSAAASAALTIKGSATAANTLTGGAANDAITGGAKADVIKGGLGGDTLTGGAGNDTFVYTAGDSSIGTGKFDTITDFKANTYGNGTSGAAGTGANATASKLTGDVLQFVHAGNGTGGVIADVFTSAADASTYLANHAVTGGGTVTTVTAALDSSGNNLYVDNTGDGIADFYIHLTGVTTITAAAFTLV